MSFRARGKQAVPSLPYDALLKWTVLYCAFLSLTTDPSEHNGTSQAGCLVQLRMYRFYSALDFVPF